MNWTNNVRFSFQRYAWIYSDRSPPTYVWLSSPSKQFATIIIHTEIDHSISLSPTKSTFLYLIFLYLTSPKRYLLTDVFWSDSAFVSLTRKPIVWRMRVPSVISSSLGILLRSSKEIIKKETSIRCCVRQLSVWFFRHFCPTKIILI